MQKINTKNYTYDRLAQEINGRKGVIYNKKDALAASFLNGTPRGIRIPVYTVKGCCPRPLDDGSLYYRG